MEPAKMRLLEARLKNLVEENNQEKTVVILPQALPNIYVC